MKNNYGNCMEQKQRQKKKKQKQRKELEKRRASSGGQIGHHELLVCEILSRLPVKSLMRFKCVCKQWQSIIQKDQFFIDLHLSRSKATTRTSFLLVGNNNRSSESVYLLSAELLLPSNEQNGCVEVGTTCLWEPHVLKTHLAFQPAFATASACSLNGLICFMDTSYYHAACVYNSSTKETTPWIKSAVKQLIQRRRAKQQRRHGRFLGFRSFVPFREKEDLHLLKHEFGYDPTTKQYKVIALWRLFHYGNPVGDMLCEVMTVGQNSWRMIDQVDQSYISPYKIESSVCVNGFIYLLCKQFDGDFIALSIVEFSVDSEKFRLVETLARYTRRVYEIFRKENSRLRSLIEVNGRLCVLTYNTQEENISISMHTLHDREENVQDKKHKMTTSIDGSNKYYWVEETIILPHYTEVTSVRHIPGTNLFIIRSLEGFSIYHANQKNKCYSISMINSKVHAASRKDNGRFRYCFEFDTFTPSLLPVN